MFWLVSENDDPCCASERCALADGSARLEVDGDIEGRSCPSSPTNDEQIGVES